MANINKPTIVYVGLVRRLMAIFYDLLLIIAILFIATVIANALNRGEPIEPENPYYPLFVLYLLAISFFYYGWFWTHGGQTLGLQTWKMKLISSKHQSISWLQASIRMIAALFSWSCLGLGFLWSLFSSKKQTWHDMLSHTELVDLRDAKN
jgi:uncharacterized RDD family membrane protein YckC